MTPEANLFLSYSLLSCWKVETFMKACVPLNNLSIWFFWADPYFSCALLFTRRAQYKWHSMAVWRPRERAKHKCQHIRFYSGPLGIKYQAFVGEVSSHTSAFVRRGGLGKAEPRRLISDKGDLKERHYLGALCVSHHVLRGGAHLGTSVYLCRKHPREESGPAQVSHC